MYDVCCIGILVADIIVKTVDNLPDKGKLALTSNINLYSGGCAMSASIDLAKLGASTSILGMIGQDGFGSHLLDELNSSGVNTQGLVQCGEHSTSASIVLVDSMGERSFLHCTGSNAFFNDNNINYDVLFDAQIVFIAGSLLMPSFDGLPCQRVLKHCKEHQQITVLDTAWDDTNRWMDTLSPCLPYVDYFIPSLDEAKELAKKDSVEEIAGVFFDLGVKHVIIKLGKEGCYVKEFPGQEGIIVPSYPDIESVDTTGAGDSFCAGFLYGLSHNLTMLESAQLGNAVGAHCITQTGATTGIKPYSEIKKFMEANIC